MNSLFSFEQEESPQGCYDEQQQNLSCMRPWIESLSAEPVTLLGKPTPSAPNKDTRSNPASRYYAIPLVFFLVAQQWGQTNTCRAITRLRAANRPMHALRMRAGVLTGLSNEHSRPGPHTSPTRPIARSKTCSRWDGHLTAQAMDSELSPFGPRHHQMV
jgi:hypothetical protein